MKVVALYAAMPGFEQGLNHIIKIFQDTLGELGIDMEVINLSTSGIHYFDGVSSKSVENILDAINLSDGVIFSASSSLLAPCAVMQTFIEHIDFDVYKNVFINKRCFVITSSKDGSERISAEYMKNIINSFGAIDIGSMSVGKDYVSSLNSNSDVKEMIEKYAEDFYRVLRQDRKFFTSYNNYSKNSGNTYGNLEENLSEIPKSSILKGEYAKKIKADDLLKQINFKEFDQRQEQDINEISKFLSNEYGKSSSQNLNYNNPQDLYSNFSNIKNNENIVPHIKTCKQRTQSLYHYFQPQLSDGMKAIIQINIRGDEKFEGYLVIENRECSYYDGVHSEPDVTVFAQSNIWLDILNGKYTTQKAFMIGQLKVRGNFVLLTKFDQLFKIVG